MSAFRSRRHSLQQRDAARLPVETPPATRRWPSDSARPAHRSVARSIAWTWPSLHGARCSAATAHTRRAAWPEHCQSAMPITVEVGGVPACPVPIHVPPAVRPAAAGAPLCPQFVVLSGWVDAAGRGDRSMQHGRPGHYPGNRQGEERSRDGSHPSVPPPGVRFGWTPGQSLGERRRCIGSRGEPVAPVRPGDGGGADATGMSRAARQPRPAPTRRGLPSGERSFVPPRGSSTPAWPLISGQAGSRPM